MHREVGYAAFWRLHPCVEGYSLCRAQWVAVAVLVHQITLFGETEIISFLVFYREMYGEYNLTGFQFAVRHIYAGHCHGVLDGLECLCLPRYCDEGK